MNTKVNTSFIFSHFVTTLLSKATSRLFSIQLVSLKSQILFSPSFVLVDRRPWKELNLWIWPGNLVGGSTYWTCTVFQRRPKLGVLEELQMIFTLKTLFVNNIQKRMSRLRIMTSYFLIEDHYQSLFLYTVIAIASIIIAIIIFFFGRHFRETLGGTNRL